MNNRIDQRRSPCGQQGSLFSTQSPLFFLLGGNADVAKVYSKITVNLLTSYHLATPNGRARQSDSSCLAHKR